MRNRYYKWIISLVCDDQYDSRYYSKLLYDLDNIEFTWIDELDANRAADGLYLRESFAMAHDCVMRKGPCSVLEMMIGLACRIEREYLEDGGANEFFWCMIKSLGLYLNDDYNYDPERTSKAVHVMLNREYDRDGKGGLFRLSNPPENLRRVEIWQQAIWYLNELYSERNRGWI